jgi:hypothetical protein
VGFSREQTVEQRPAIVDSVVLLAAFNPSTGRRVSPPDGTVIVVVVGSSFGLPWRRVGERRTNGAPGSGGLGGGHCRRGIVSSRGLRRASRCPLRRLVTALGWTLKALWKVGFCGKGSWRQSGLPRVFEPIWRRLLLLRLAAPPTCGDQVLDEVCAHGPAGTRERVGGRFNAVARRWAGRIQSPGGASSAIACLLPRRRRSESSCALA